jgi:hypothetical protein
MHGSRVGPTCGSTASSRVRPVLQLHAPLAPLSNYPWRSRFTMRLLCANRLVELHRTSPFSYWKARAHVSIADAQTREALPYHKQNRPPTAPRPFSIPTAGESPGALLVSALYFILCGRLMAAGKPLAWLPQSSNWGNRYNRRLSYQNRTPGPGYYAHWRAPILHTWVRRIYSRVFSCCSIL